MKPLHIVILLAAGAIGGAVIMKVAQKPQTAAPAPVVAQVQTPPATAPATPPAEPADARATGVPANPSPFETPKPVREAPKPGRAHRAAVNQPPAVVAPPGEPMAPAPAAPAPAEPAPQPVPPARIEPENVTPPPPPLRPSPTGLR